MQQGHGAQSCVSRPASRRLPEAGGRTIAVHGRTGKAEYCIAYGAFPSGAAVPSRSLPSKLPLLRLFLRLFLVRMVLVKACNFASQVHLKRCRLLCSPYLPNLPPLFIAAHLHDLLANTLGTFLPVDSTPLPQAGCERRGVAESCVSSVKLLGEVGGHFHVTSSPRCR